MACGKLLGRRQEREGLHHDDQRLVQGIRVRGGCGQEPRLKGGPGRLQPRAQGPPRLGSNGSTGLFYRPTMIVFQSDNFRRFFTFVCNGSPN